MHAVVVDDRMTETPVILCMQSPSLITISPTKHIRARVGVAAGKSGISVSFAAAPGPAPATAPAPAPGPGPGSSASEPQGTP